MFTQSLRQAVQSHLRHPSYLWRYSYSLLSKDDMAPFCHGASTA